MLACGSSSMELRSSATLPSRDRVCTLQPLIISNKNKFHWAGLLLVLPGKRKNTQVALQMWFLLSGRQRPCVKVEYKLQLCICSLKIQLKQHLQRTQNSVCVWGKSQFEYRLSGKISKACFLLVVPSPKLCVCFVKTPNSKHLVLDGDDAFFYANQHPEPFLFEAKTNYASF